MSEFFCRRGSAWRLAVLGFGIAVLLVSPAVGVAKSGLVWRVVPNQVDAEIDGWPLSKLLNRLSESTGWQIFVEPETEHPVSTRFTKLPAREALARLLGDLNFALLPQTNAATKLFVYRTSLQEATQLISPPKPARAVSASGKPIPNELVVSLKPGAKETIEALARRLGAKVIGRLDGRDAYRLQFDDEAAAKAGRALLNGSSDVAAVDYNYLVGRPSQPEGLAFSSPLPSSLQPASPGNSRLVIGLVDATVQQEDSRIKSFLLPGYTVVDNPQAASTELSHGTSMAETILQGIALGTPENRNTSVRILPVDVYGGNPTTTTFEVASGIYTAVKQGANIINLSLGSAADSPFLHNLIQESAGKGVLFIAAAGNEPTTAPTYPAAYPEVLAVTAGDRSGHIASYANRGDFVDVVAPGSSIIPYQNQTYLGIGTSFSTAYVSGLAAGLASQSGKSPLQVEGEIRRILAVNRTPVGSP